MPASRQNQHRLRVVAIAMAVFALVLRLAWTVPMPFDPERGIAGEHALCLSGAPSADPVRTVPLDGAPTAPGGHTDHDAAGCCQWHMGGGIILPGTGAATRIAFGTRADQFIAAATPALVRSASQAQARAPPSSET
jgi:hypothetical protein